MEATVGEFFSNVTTANAAASVLQTTPTKSTTIATSQIMKSRPFYCYYNFVGWYHVPLLITGILIIVINFPVLIFVKTSKILKQNAGNFILMGLSLVDLLTGFSAVLHVIPTFYFMATNTCDNYLFREYDNAGYLIGKICLLGSIGHLLLLASERMIRLFRPFNYKSMIVSKKVIPFVSCVWLVSICFPLLELTYQKTENEIFFRKLHVTITIIGFWIFPLILLCTQYIAMLILIYKFQQKRALDINSIFLRYKAFFIYLAMFVSFLILSSPHFAVRIVIAFTDRLYGLSLDMLRVFAILRFLPSLTNPFLYGVLKEDFQQALWRRRGRFSSSTLKSETEPWMLSRVSTRRQNENNNAMLEVVSHHHQHHQETMINGTPTDDTELT